VRGLEERLGAILIVRGNPCEPTALGRTLCSHLDRVRLLEHDIAPSLGRGVADVEHPVTVRVAVNADSLATWFPAAITAFAKLDGVSLDLTLDDETATAGKLRSGDVQAAVTADSEPVQGCKTNSLGALRYAACASPDFVARNFADGLTAQALARAPYLRFDRRDALQQRWAREVHGVELAGLTHWIPSAQGFVDLALRGLGWGMQPLDLVEAHIAEGRLIELPPGRRIDIPLYWTVARLHSASLQRLTDEVRAAGRRLLAN
jgi:LysR family transcriptional regulator (chromosome initiation inhibitor)